MTQSGLAPPLRRTREYAPKWDGGISIMRSPSKPLFKAYELIAIAAFVVAAVAISSIGLVY